MEKEKFIKMDKKEFKDIIRILFLFSILSIPFWFFYKTHYEFFGLFSVLLLSFFNHFFSKKYNFLYIESRLYLSLFIPLILFYFRII